MELESRSVSSQPWELFRFMPTGPAPVKRIIEWIRVVTLDQVVTGSNKCQKELSSVKCMEFLCDSCKTVSQI